MSAPSVVVLGGGLSGMALAWEIARNGFEDVTVVERGAELGGLAGTFESGGNFYPLGYHHILHRDRALLYVLEAIGALPRVRWRKIRMLFHLDGQLHDLADPVGFLRFPMRFPDKVRFARLMLRTFRKSNWDDWLDRSAADLVDAWGGPGVRRTLFEPLSRLKFELAAEEISGAWLGARLHFREGSAPLGYIPDSNWTLDLCRGLEQLMRDAGVKVRLDSRIQKLHHDGSRLRSAELESGEQIEAELFCNTLPTEVYHGMVPEDRTPEIASIRYTALISAICAAPQEVLPEFYWMNLASLDRLACGIFLLNSLNPTIGQPGEVCVNFVSHVQDRSREVFRRKNEDLIAGYLEDFQAVFGFELQPTWTRLNRVSMYSPIFLRGYRNPPLHSSTLSNLYFAGNYRTFPSVASTGTAMRSGFETASSMLVDQGRSSPVMQHIENYRLGSMPRP